MIRLTLDSAETGTKMLRYLNKLLPKAPSSFWHKAVRRNMIKINAKHCKDLACVLKEGDVIELYLNDQQLADFGYKETKETRLPVRNDLKLPVLYEDDQILAVDKPRGLLTQKSKASDISATEIAQAMLLQNGASFSRTFVPSFCHRLDRNTSGVLIMAKTLEASQQITAGFKDHSIEKIYYALVEGEPTQWTESTLLRHRYHKDPHANKATLSDVSAEEEGADICASYVRLIKSYRIFSLVEVRLLTGKSHQIRAQLAYAGHPILQDAKYNPSARQYAQMLTAKAAVFHGLQNDLAYLNGKRIEQPLPLDMKKLIENEENRNHASSDR